MIRNLHRISNRWRFRLLPRGLLALAGFFAAGAPASSAEPSYFPSFTGKETWTYQVTVDGKVSPFGIESGKNVKGDFILISFDPGKDRTRQISNVLLVVDADACMVDPWLKIVLRQGERCRKAPKKGETWKTKLPWGKGAFRLETHFHGEEEVTTPAGKFAALKFTMGGMVLGADDRPSASITTTYWYAAGAMGVVKVESEATTGNGKQRFAAEFESLTRP